MKDTKHTPGPWTIHGLTVCETTRENRDGSTGGGFVAGCYDPDVEDFSLDDELFEQAEANAKLISLAPELLESLRELVCMVEEMLPEAGPCGWGTLATEHARELIAKAEGSKQ